MGSIRRRAISSHGYGLLTWLSIPFALLIFIGFWISTYVLWKTITEPTASEEPASYCYTIKKDKFISKLNITIIN